MYTEEQKAASARWYEKNKYKISEKRRGARKEEHQATYKNQLDKYGREALNKKAYDWRLANLDKAKSILEKSRKNNPERSILSKARTSSKSRGLEFNLTIEDIIIPEVCPYFNVPLNPWGPLDFVPSIDRIDNNKGYIKGNIEIISYLANKMKHTANREQLIKFANSILHKYKDIIEYT